MSLRNPRKTSRTLLQPGTYLANLRMWIGDVTDHYSAGPGLPTNDTKVYRTGSKEMVVYLDSLQQPNGLFYQ